MIASQNIGQPYNLIPSGLVVPGRILITMSKRDFMNYDPIYGDKLYESFISQSSENYCELIMFMFKLFFFNYYIYVNFLFKLVLGFSSTQSILEDDHTQTGSTTVSGMLKETASNDNFFFLFFLFKIINFCKKKYNLFFYLTRQKKLFLLLIIADAESEDSVEMFPKRQGPGRPKGVKQKKPCVLNYFFIII